MNPFLKRMRSATPQQAGINSEKRVAKQVNGRQTPGSGSRRGLKGDIKIQGERKFLMEAKATQNLTMALDSGWLVKIREEAQTQASIPAVSITFVDADGKPRRSSGGTWVMIPLEAFNELT